MTLSAPTLSLTCLVLAVLVRARNSLPAPEDYGWNAWSTKCSWSKGYLNHDHLPCCDDLDHVEHNAIKSCRWQYLRASRYDDHDDDDDDDDDDDEGHKNELDDCKVAVKAAKKAEEEKCEKTIDAEECSAGAYDIGQQVAVVYCNAATGAPDTTLHYRIHPVTPEECRHIRREECEHVAVKVAHEYVEKGWCKPDDGEIYDKEDVDEHKLKDMCKEYVDASIAD